MPKRVIASDRLMQPIAHFSHGARVGTTVHLGAAAGVDTSRRLAGTTVGVADMTAQADRMFDNLRIALEALGGAWHQVVRLKTYLVDWRDLPAYNAVCARHFKAPYPAASTVGTWGFPLPQILLETELVACLDSAEGVGKLLAPARAASSGGVSAGGLHYCTAASVDERGAVSEPLDAGALAERALRNLSKLLEQGELELGDVGMLTVSLADLRALPAFDEAFRKYFRPPYPARSVVGVPLAHPGQLIEVESIAASGGGVPIAPAGNSAPGVMASPGMRLGDWLFVSAQTSGEEPDVERQTRRAWEGVAAVLETAGLTPDDVVRTNNILTDWRSYAGFNAGYGAFVTRPYPPRATVHAELADPRACVQIEAIAHRQGRDATVLEAAEPKRGLSA
jgi:enamine deaminase RidA (YjgF/YER057c/UK114 family)